MLFCKDCNSYLDFGGLGEPSCSHDKAIEYSTPATGELPTCKKMRTTSDACGLTAKWFKDLKQDAK